MPGSVGLLLLAAAVLKQGSAPCVLSRLKVWNGSAAVNLPALRHGNAALASSFSALPAGKDATCLRTLNASENTCLTTRMKATGAFLCKENVRIVDACFFGVS